MNRVHALRGTAVCAVLLFVVPVFAATFTSQQSGDWSAPATWGGSVPVFSDDVVITSSHVVTVSDSRLANTVTLDSTAGNKMLVIQSTGTLTIERALPPALILQAPSPGSSNTVRIDGGTLETSNAGVSITGGASGASKLEFTSLGGTARFAGDVAFAGTPANAQIDFGNSTGTVEIGGDLGSGGTLTNNTSGTVEINGTGAQTINSYTFHHFTVNKGGGTATLNGPIQVGSTFSIPQGVLDDGGHQISLNGSGLSTTFIGSLGVLKLGSAATATTFPAPHGPVVLSAGSAVVYQAGVAQTIQSDFPYDRLYLSTMGGSVTKSLSGASLTVNGELNIQNNGANVVTLVLGTNSLDANADISGNGTVSVTSGTIDIAGNWSNAGTLSAGTSTISYDGTGAQNVLPATYHALYFPKASGIASFGGNVTVNSLLHIGGGTLDAGANQVTLLGDLTILATGTFTANSATVKLNGTSEQAISNGMPGALTLGHLQVNNAVGAAITGDLSITGSLSLNGGTVTTSDSFFVDVLATLNRTTGWIIGPLTLGMNPTPARSFPIGTTTAFMPVDVDAGSAGMVTIRAVDGLHPSKTGLNLLNRYWKIENPSSATPLDSLLFHYNEGDWSTGTESKFHLAKYNAGWTQYGDVVNDTTNVATGTNVSSYLGDWVVGQRGSLGAAGMLDISSINGDVDPSVNTPFDVDVRALHDNGTTANVTSNTTVNLAVLTGTGNLGGTTSGVINAGTNNVTISGVVYDTIENGVVLRAARTAGDEVDLADSAAFNVVTPPSTYSVTSINDSGFGTLRQGILDANSGACSSPCAISFSTSGNILLSTALPAITADNVVIDGFTAPGASANTNSFGQPSNAVLTVAIDGGGSVSVGFEIQAAFVDIKGLAVKNFGNNGVVFGSSATGAIVSGCYIGTDLTGTLAAASPTGVHFAGASNSTLGGFTPAARNVISGNSQWGVIADTGANSIGLYGNYIGVKADLSGALANNTGVKFFSGTTGGVGSASAGNVIAGNLLSGLVLEAGGISVKGNYIGLAGSSGLAAPNATGIQIDSGSNANVIGGASPSEINYIGANSQNGILINSDGNVIDNNVIGLAPDGVTARGNGGHGIRLENNAANNVIGASFGNKIVYHTGDGVSIATTGVGIGNVVRKSKIAGNGSLAIDLGDDGPTGNDPSDSDVGPNNRQNHPTITARYNAGNLDVKLALDSSAGVSANFYTFDVYKTDGTGQALEYLGSSGCQSGNVFVSLAFSVGAGSAVVGNDVVATATAFSDAGCSTPSEGTSELSSAARIGGEVHWIAGSGSWENPANWSPAVVPTSGDDAYIDNAGTYTVTINSLASVSSLQLGAASGTQTLQIGGSQSLTLNGASTITANGILNHGGSALGGSGTLTVFGQMNWSIGTIAGGGGVVIESGATLSLNSASVKTLNGALLTVDTGGTATWDGGPVNLINGGAIDNNGLFEIRTDNTISDGGSAGTFDNIGTLRKSTTSGTTTFSNITLNHNAGSIDLQTGTLNVSGGTSVAPMTVASGAAFYVDDSTFAFNNGSGMTGAGKIHINGGTLAVNGPSVAIERLLLDSGTLGGTGTAKSSATGSWAWNGGTMSGGGTTQIESGASLSIGSASAKALSNRTLSVLNGGSVTVNGSGTINLANGGTINNAGTVDLTVDVTFNDAGFDGGITNTSLFKKSGPGTTSISNVDFTNSGTLKVLAGTFNPAKLTNSGAVELTGTLLVDSDSVTLQGATDVQGAGLLQVASGTLTVDANEELPNVQLDSPGVINGTAGFDITSFLWNGGTMSGSGTTNLNTGATATIATANAKALQRTFYVASGAQALVTGSGTINLSAGGTIGNDGLFDYQTDGAISDAGGDSGILNTGTFRKSGGFGTTSISNVDFTNSGNLFVQSGTLNPTLVTSSGNVIVSTNCTLLVDDSTVTLTGGDVSGAGLLRILGGTVTADAADTFPKIQLDLGTLNGTGNISIQTLDWNGGLMSGAGTITIPALGTATLAGGGAKALQRALSVANGGTVNVTGTGTINVGSGGSIANDGLIEITENVSVNDSGSAGDIVNTRTFRVNIASGFATLGVTLNNSGGSATVDLVSGSLNLADGTSSGAFAIGGLSSLFVDSHPYTFAAGTTVTGGGIINLDSTGTLLVTGNVSVPNLNQVNGTLGGSGTLTLTGASSWSGGVMQGGGTTAVANGATLTLSGFSAKAVDNRALSVLAGGTVDLTGGGQVNLSNGGAISNAGSFNVTANNNFNNAGSGGNFDNSGTFTKSAATGPTNFSGIGFTNNGGLVDLQSGILSVTSDTYTQTGGTLKIWLGGTAVGTGYAQLSTSTTPTLSGTLQLALVGPYQPAGGDSFRVVSATAHSGDFNQPYSYPPLAGGRTFSDAWDASGLLISVSGVADVSIAKSAPSNVLAGGAIAYTLTVNNAGPDVASSVSVTDTLQSGHTGITAGGTGWTCNAVALTVTCTAASLPTGVAPAITINATAPSTPQTFTNVANVSASNDSTPGNNSGSAVVTVDPLAADLELVALSPATPLAPSTPFTFDFEIRNHGPQPATSVVFTAPIPPTLTFNSAVPEAGTCNFSTGTVTCNVGNIANGANLNVVLNITTTSTAGTHSVTGSADALESDPDPTDDTIAAEVEVTGSTITVTNTNDTGTGSLRAALEDASNGVCTPLPCTITFNLAATPYVIAPQSNLPALADQTIVDATTQPGYAGVPLVELDGTSVSTLLTLAGDNNVVRGFAIANASGPGISISGNNNVVEGNYIGLDRFGAAASNGDGVAVTGNGNIIGGTLASQRNVISGNTAHGIILSGTAGGNTIAGNYIGTDAAGNAARPNIAGIEIVDDADANTIGGATAAHRNVISGNTTFGIYIEGTVSVGIARGGVGTHGAAPSGNGVIDGTIIRNNWIGPNATGNAALPNGVTGITLVDLTAGTVIEANVISGNTDGISFAGADVTGTAVSGNFIGLAPDGTTPMGNTQSGIIIADGSGNIIGITPNRIAHNGTWGIVALGGSANASISNLIHNNALLGIDLNGDGVSGNDANDNDGGANGTQNFPLLGTATLTGGGNVSVSYGLDSSGSPAPVNSVRIELFEADAAGEGKAFLFAACVGGNILTGTINFTAPSIAAGDPIVATATSYSDGACGTLADGTSEFSNVVNAAACTPPPVTITGAASSCGTGTITLDAGPGFASYAWNTGANTRTISVSPSSTTTYTVTVTTNLGCTNSDSHTITVHTPPTVIIGGPASTCAGGSVTLDAGPGFTNYAWSTGATTQQITVSPSSTQTYSITVTDANGCTAADTHTVTVTSNPTITITGPADVCPGGSVVLDAGPGYATYSWSTGATTQQITVSPSSTTTYSVTVGNGSCTASDTHTVTVSSTPTATITPSGPTTFCAGGSVTLTASAGVSYLWSNGATTQQITVSASGTFTVQVSNGTCNATSAPVTVSVTAAPVVNITGPAATCAAAPVTLDAGPGFASYAWSNGATTQQITVSPSSTTTYSVTVTSGSGCSATDSHTVSVTTNPTASIVAPAGICENSTASASVAPQSGATYTWTVGNGTLLSGQGTNAITFSGTTGSVSLSVTVNAGTCTSSGNATVPVSSRPSAVITAPATAAPNQSGLVASVPVTAGATYVWSVTNGSLTAGQGTNSITFTAGSSGTTGVLVTVSTGACSESNGHQLFIEGGAPQSADLAVTKSGPGTTVIGGALAYTITVANVGTLDAGGVVVTDNFPPGTTFVSMDGGPWNCSRMNAGIRCTGVAPAGSRSSIALVLEGPSSRGLIVNTADVTSATPDTNLSNNSSSVTTMVGGEECSNVPPTLHAPLDGATVPSPVTFSWSSIAGRSAYELWLDDRLAATTGSTSITLPVASGTSRWFVVAHRADCPSVTSAVRTFTVQPSSSCGSNGTPQLVTPSGGATVASPTAIVWTPVPNAIGYRVWVEANGTAAQDAGTTDGATQLTLPLPAGPVVLTVEALFNGCPSTRSAPVALTVLRDSCAARAEAVATFPADNAVLGSSHVFFRWDEAVGASGYRVWASVDGGAPAVLGKTTGNSLETAIPRGEVVWWIESLYEGCASTESQPRRFTIPTRNDCTDTRPELLAPVRNRQIADALVHFSWSGVPGAVSYELWASFDHGPDTLLGSSRDTLQTHVVPPGQVDWFVRVNLERCPPRDSQTFRLTYTPPAACADVARPQLVEPLDGAETGQLVPLSWTAVPGASSYEVYVTQNGETRLLQTVTVGNETSERFFDGSVRWFVRAQRGNCSPLDSGERTFEVVTDTPACNTPAAPRVVAPGQISSGVPFLIQWTPARGATNYQLQLADNAAFTGAQLITTSATSYSLVRTNAGSEPVALYARVRAFDGGCTPPAVSAYGTASAVFILPRSGSEGSAPLGTTRLQFTIPLGAELAGRTFVATPKQSWLTVVPASGVVGPIGTTLAVTADTTGLPAGTSLGGVTVSIAASNAGGVATNDTVTIPSNFSVSMVTPVTPSPNDTPPPDALIIPAVAHAGGINSQFQSDVRVSNTSARAIEYRLTFTPSGDSGITQGQQTQFSIEPGRTIALDDILETWFGTGNGSAIGTLEIRPLTQTSASTSSSAFSGLANLLTFASSRTFNVTSNGTFGQYIPAIPFANFVGRDKLLSLQQIAQSSRYRTNLGIVEGSGNPASLIVRVFGESGQYLTDFPLQLRGGQHLQLNAFLRAQGIGNLNDGRVEIEVLSGDGLVTAYASVLDNETSDPLLVTPVTLGEVDATKWVMPGVADLTSGFANWQTDMRLFNAGQSAVDVTLTFHSQGGGEPKVRTLTIPAGQVRQFDRTLASVFDTTNDGGAVHITTSEPAKLIATARTYNQTGSGTYGQFISAITPDAAAGLESRPLQLLQVEESERFRSNIGLVEVSGKPVKVEISAIPPDAKFSAVTELELRPNEFRQLGSLLKSMGLDGTYNARVTVRVLEGEGRVTAYASVIDMQTNDPTYIPAQ